LNDKKSFRSLGQAAAAPGPPSPFSKTLRRCRARRACVWNDLCWHTSSNTWFPAIGAEV
ncbi:mCG1037040, partial [Mus musculus]